MRLFDRKILLSNWWLPLCQQEEEWDALINEQLQEPEDTVKWADAVQLAIQENVASHQAENAKDKEMTYKMQRSVDLETRLAREEGQTIVRGRKRRRIRVIRP